MNQARRVQHTEFRRRTAIGNAIDESYMPVVDPLGFPRLPPVIQRSTVGYLGQLDTLVPADAFA